MCVNIGEGQFLLLPTMVCFASGNITVVSALANPDHSVVWKKPLSTVEGQFPEPLIQVNIRQVSQNSALKCRFCHLSAWPGV
jgi:hypothetical protein